MTILSPRLTGKGSECSHTDQVGMKTREVVLWHIEGSGVGYQHSGSRRGPGLVWKAKFCSAIPFQGSSTEKASLTLGFLQKSPIPSWVSGTWLWHPLQQASR